MPRSREGGKFLPGCPRGTYTARWSTRTRTVPGRAREYRPATPRWARSDHWPKRPPGPPRSQPSGGYIELGVNVLGSGVTLKGSHRGRWRFRIDPAQPRSTSVSPTPPKTVTYKYSHNEGVSYTTKLTATVPPIGIHPGPRSPWDITVGHGQLRPTSATSGTGDRQDSGSTLHTSSWKGRELVLGRRGRQSLSA